MLEEAARNFIDKVDRGEAKSTDSYSKFKRALETDPAEGLPRCGEMACTNYRQTGEICHPCSSSPAGTGDEFKLVYLKPWRTLFKIPAKIADEVREAINGRSQPESSGWQSIETAPKDGERILVCGGRYDGVQITLADGAYWRNQRALGSKAIPERWMPLPSIPSEGQS